MPETDSGDPSPKLHAAGYADLLATVPYLLGFHPNPAGDLVVIGLRTKRVVLHVRPGLDTPPDAPDMVTRLLTSDARVNRAVVVGYGAAEHDPAIRTMADTLTAAGLNVDIVLRVTDGRYFCLRCDDCVPAGGAPFEHTTTVAAAQATLAGMVALPDRDAVAGRVAHQPATAAAMRSALRAAADQLRATRPDPAAILDDALERTETGNPLDDHTAATSLLLLQHSRWRTHAWLATTGQPWHVELWCELTRRCPPAHAGPVASLAAWAAWRSGDVVTTQAALDRALAADPDNQIAGLIRDLLVRYVPPATIPWPPTDLPPDIGHGDDHDEPHADEARQ